MSRDAYYKFCLIDSSSDDGKKKIELLKKNGAQIIACDTVKQSDPVIFGLLLNSTSAFVTYQNDFELRWLSGQGVVSNGNIGNVMRNLLLIDDVIWIGAELESVDHVIKTGVRAKLTNVRTFLRPTFKNIGLYSRETVKFSKISMHDRDNIESHEGYIVNTVTNEVINKPYLIEAKPSGQAKLRTIELPLLTRFKNILLIGGSPGSSWNDYPKLINKRRIIVVDPRDVEFNCIHIKSEASLDNILGIINREFKDIPYRDIGVHVDIRRDRGALSLTAWENLIVTDQTLIANLMILLCSKGMTVIGKFRPFYKRDTTLLVTGTRLVQALHRPNSHEFRIECSIRKCEVITYSTKELINELDAYNKERTSNKYVDALVIRAHMARSISQVHADSYLLKPECSIGLFSLSNSINKYSKLISFCKDGGIMTFPFISLFEGTTLLRTRVGNENFEDHALNCLMQFDFPYMYSLYAYSLIKGCPVLSNEAIKTVIICPYLLSVEQNLHNKTSMFVKYISNLVRALLPDNLFEYPYDVRNEIIRDCALPWDAKVEWKDDIPYINNRPVEVSGHLIYIMLGEILGYPTGIRRYFNEKEWNRLGVEGNETRTGQWHTYEEDWYACQCVEKLITRMRLNMNRSIFRDVQKYCYKCSNLIIDARRATVSGSL